MIYAQSIVIADFDGDGNPDVAVGRNEGVTVLLGEGGGRFGTPRETPTNGVPYIAAGDFNEDGFPDLAAIQTGGISILIGGASGRFASGPIIPTSGFPAALAVGDFDHDGHLDVVVGQEYPSNSIGLFRGDGQGHLLFAGDFPAGLDLPSHLAVGDFNGDGYDDIAVASSAGLSVLLGGPAGFSSAIPLNGTQSITAVQLADINGDGKPDVLAAVYFGDVLLYPGDGTGHFGSPQNIHMGGEPAALAVADLNGDGKLDLAAAGYQYSELVIRLGDGTGGFGPPKSIGVANASSLAIADLDGDGLPDFAIANGTDVSIVLGDGSGGTQTRVFSTGPAPNAVALADFDGDGHVDVATADSDFSGGMTVRLADGNGGFGPPTSYTQVGSLLSVVALDLNGDGKPDLVGQNGPYGTFIFLNDGTGHFGPPTTVSTCSTFASPVVGDVNGDGRLDLVVACGNAISVLLGNGTGGFGAAILSPAPASTWIAMGDVNGDGKLDIVLGHFAGYQVAVLLGDGTGHFSAPLFSTTPHYGVGGIALGDFDGDGKLDVATSAFLQGNNLDVMFGDGTGYFGSSRSFPMIASRVSFAADVNGDGLPDVIAVHSDSIEILMNEGAGNFLPTRSYLSGKATSSVAASDLNGDGKLDLVSSNRDEDSFTLLLNTSCEARHLALEPRFAACSSPGSPITPAPVVSVIDDGGNVSTCAEGTVTASLHAGAQGNSLSGTLTVPIENGVAEFQDLAISSAGRSVLEFMASGAAFPTLGTFAVGTPASVAITGPFSICGNTTVSYDAGAGSSRYIWTLDGAPISFQQTASLGFLTAGPHTVAIRVSDQGCEAEASMTVANAPPSITSVAPPSGSTNGGTSLTVTGTCFAAGATLALGGASATSVSVANPGSLTGTSGSHGPGVVDAVVTNPDGQSAALSSAYTYVCDPLPAAPTVGNNGPICEGQTLQLTASWVPGATYQWTGPNDFTSSLRNPSIPGATTAASGTYSLTITLNGCDSPPATTDAVVNAGPCASSFYTVTACRLVDTRGPSGPSGGPSLSPGAPRTFPITGRCGVPSPATSVAITIAAISPGDAGDIRLYPAGKAPPNASVINFRSGVTRAGNAIVPLGTGGWLTAFLDMPIGSSATTDVIIDVYGFFQ